MVKTRVLFVCIQNSARSQMAEALLNNLYGDRFEAESAGLEPGNLNRFAVRAMKEKGIDISQKRTNAVLEFFKTGRLYSYVITVCDEASGERCPIFPGISAKLHWSFEDPSSFTGSDIERLEKTIEVRDKIEKKIRDWVSSLNTQQKNLTQR
jgi:arsenate reductase